MDQDDILCWPMAPNKLCPPKRWVLIPFKIAVAEEKSRYLSQSRYWRQPFARKKNPSYWLIASWQVLFNCIKRLLGWSRKCLSQSETRATIFANRSFRKKNPHKLGWCFLSSFVKFRSVYYNRGEVDNVSINQGQGRPSLFADRSGKHIIW